MDYTSQYYLLLYRGIDRRPMIHTREANRFWTIQRRGAGYSFRFSRRNQPCGHLSEDDSDDLLLKRRENIE